MGLWGVLESLADAVGPFAEMFYEYATKYWYISIALIIGVVFIILRLL